MGINIRTKGQSAEREIVKLIAPIVAKYYPDEEVGRNLDQTRDGGHDITGVPGFAIEVKRQESIHLKGCWDQTMKQAIIAQGRPVLLFRRNHKKWRAVISMYELLPSVVNGDYGYTLEMSLEAFLVWFEDRMIVDSEWIVG